MLVISSWGADCDNYSPSISYCRHAVLVPACQEPAPHCPARTVEAADVVGLSCGPPPILRAAPGPIWRPRSCVRLEGSAGMTADSDARPAVWRVLANGKRALSAPSASLNEDAS